MVSICRIKEIIDILILFNGKMLIYQLSENYIIREINKISFAELRFNVKKSKKKTCG